MPHAIKPRLARILFVHRPFLRGLAIGSLLAGVLLSTTTALAGSGIGAIFNLGKTNTVNKTSVLTGSVSSRMLQVTNTGTGSALTLNVQPGAPPLAVNSTTRVDNLNADLLDGIDSSGFVQGSATVVQGRLSELLNSGNGVVLTVPGIGTVEASCGAGGVPNYRLFWRNGLSGATLDTWHSDGTVASSIVTATYVSLAAGAGTYVAPVDGAVDRVVTIQAGTAGGKVVHLTISAHTDAGGCVFYAQAVVH